MSQRAVQRYIQGLIHYTTKAPWSTVLLALVMAAVALWYTGVALRFETSRNTLASSHAPYIQAYNEIKADFGSLDNIVVVIEPPSVERGKAFVQALAPRLRADTQHIERVLEKIDTSSLEGKKLLLLSADELRTLQQRLKDAQDFMVNMSANPGVRQLLASVNEEISKALVTHLTGGLLGGSASTDTASEGETQALDVSFLATLFVEMERAIATPDTYLFHSPWDSFFVKDGKVFSEEGYLTSKNKRFFFVLIDDRSTPGSFVNHAAPLRALRAHLQALRRDFPDVQTGVTGGQALASDEMVAAQRDTTLATIIALLGVAVLFIVVFRHVWRPLLVVATLMLAVCWTLGFTTLTVGHLNILSVAFMPILIGLGIDFGIHLLARYGEERAVGHHFDTAIQTTYQHTAPGIFVAALTTALAFYAVMLTDFRGLAELGFIAGSGVMLCLLASFTVLPALLALCERHRQVRPGIWQTRQHDPLRSLQRFPRALLGLIGLFTLLGIVLFPFPRFDYNMLNMQAQGTESVVWEYRLIEGSGRSSWYATGVADTLPELYRKKAQLAALPVVERVESLASIIPEDQAVRLPLVWALAQYVEGITGAWDQPEPIDLEDIGILLQKIRFKLQRKAADWDAKKRPSEEDLTAARQALIALQERMNTTPATAVQRELESFQRAVMADFAMKLALLQRNSKPTPITLTDVPEHLRERLLGQSGRFLLQIFARDNIWEREPMQAFVTTLQAIDANITGPPVVAFYSMQQMQRGYVYGGLYAFVMIVGIVFFLFRRLQPTLLALLPLVLGALWTMASMGLIDLQLNLANLIILPLFMGIAVDSGIHIMHRRQENPATAVSPLVHSTGKAVMLSSLTTMIGFGSLMVARHTGVFSLGVLATLAIGFSLIAALVVLPLIVCLAPGEPQAVSSKQDPVRH